LWQRSGLIVSFEVEVLALTLSSEAQTPVLVVWFQAYTALA